MDVIVFIPPLVGFRLVSLPIASETRTFPDGNVVLNSPNELSGTAAATAPLFRIGFMAWLAFFQPGYFPDVERSPAPAGPVVAALHGAVMNISR